MKSTQFHKTIFIFAGAAVIATIGTDVLAGDNPMGHWIFDKAATETAYKADGKSPEDIRDALGFGEGSFIDWEKDTFQVMLGEGIVYIKCQWSADGKGKIHPLKCIDDAGKPAQNEQSGIEYVHPENDGSGKPYRLSVHVKGGGAWVYRQ